MKRVKFYAEADITVEELLKKNGISNKIIKSAKAKGNINKDNKPLHMKDIVKKGDIINLILDDDESDLAPIEMPLDIKYIDQDLMIINKDYGISVMSTINLHEECLINGINYYLIKNNIPSKVRVINRLDRNTTGLMTVALNRFSACSLNNGLKTTLKRKYYAIIKGYLDEKSGQIENKIAKESMMTTRRCVRNDGKDAVTIYKVIKEANGYSLLDIELLTGRTHQIRVTFADMLHPLLGDDLYDPDYNGEELMLHSYYLELIHPSTNEKLVLTTDIPDRFLKYIE